MFCKGFLVISHCIAGWFLALLKKKKKNGSSVAEARTGIPNFQLYTYATLTKRT